MSIITYKKIEIIAFYYVVKKNSWNKLQI